MNILKKNCAEKNCIEKIWFLRDQELVPKFCRKHMVENMHIYITKKYDKLKK